MAGTLSLYIQIISLAGFVVLTILSVMAFTDVQALKIQKGKNIHSGVILIVTAIVYGIIAAVLFYRDRKLDQVPARNVEVAFNQPSSQEYSRANSNEKLFDN